MVQRIQLGTTTEERYRQAIDRELAEFERREREIYGAGTARKSGPARLRALWSSEGDCERAVTKSRQKLRGITSSRLVTPPLADPRSWPLHARQLVDS